MNVFTFDDTYFFDRQPHDECWYAYTHPASELFSHGYFDVATCEFTRDTSDGRSFDPQQKGEIERILRSNKAHMDLGQFDVHSVLPNHYREINRRSNRFADFIDRLKWMGPTEPSFSVAFETLATQEPAYRLTREFISKVITQMERVTASEISAWLHDVTEDSWVYDYDPAPGETYDDFYRMQQRLLTVPDPERLDVMHETKLFEIDGLARLYLLEQHFDWGRESRHYVDIGPVFSPTPLGNAYII